MQRRSESDGTHRVLPDRAQPCVWMVAGLLTYRLCDRDYDCEHCPLDEGIRGSQPAPAAGAEPEIAATAPELPQASPAWGVREGRVYHPAYGWVSATAEGRLRWGVDALIAQLLDRATAVILPAEGTRLVQGAIGCWVMDDGELMPLRSAVTGTVASTNHVVQRDPALMTHSPYDAGWLVEIESREEGEGADPFGGQQGLVPPEVRRKSAGLRMERFQRAAMSYLHMHKEVGVTAQDGGERATDWRALLGRSRYHRLVSSVLR
jgi:glycine cleavage system H lipoate-binding protein